MELNKEDFPATIQAYELQDDKEIFIAEQVINNQPEIEKFTTRFSGKLIKATKVANVETKSNGNVIYKKQPSVTGLIMIIIILVIVFLVIYGISTGWIQEKFN